MEREKNLAGPIAGPTIAPPELIRRMVHLVATLSAALTIASGCKSGPPAKPAHAPHLEKTLAASAPRTVVSEEADPPEVIVGERLFRDFRFSQVYFARTRTADVNSALEVGDTTVQSLETLTGPVSHPQHGTAVSCASCHMIDDAKDIKGAGSRGYTDFARKSPTPRRDDGQTHALRNAPTLLGTSAPLRTANAEILLHFDGEFVSNEDLVKGGFTGRNFGWKPTEANLAIAHLARVIREDNGAFSAPEQGGPYARVFAGHDPAIPKEARLPEQFRLQVASASDQQIFSAVARLVSAYLTSLDFARDEDGAYSGSPFDAFLRKNQLPLSPSRGQSPQAYSSRLLKTMASRPTLQFIADGKDGTFTLHNQAFVFGADELEGFKIFAGRGQCIQCHAAPDFTDRGFHNTGVAQDEFDGVHGVGAFARLKIPTLGERNFDLHLPATARHPRAAGPFARTPSAAQPAHVDLGLWNTFANPDIPAPQAKIRKAVCRSLQLNCRRGATTDAVILAKSVGAFKTPTLRNLGQSDPYFHSGKFSTIEDTVSFYVRISALGRAGQVPGLSPHFAKMQLRADDIGPLSRFLRSLNEDYD